MTERILSSRAEKAFGFAQETAKQLITLSTAIFTITLTFLKDIAPKGVDTTWLHFAWAAYLLSAFCGILTLMALAGNLERPPDPDRDSIYSGNIKTFAMAQAVLFSVALGLTLVFGIQAT